MDIWLQLQRCNGRVGSSDKGPRGRSARPTSAEAERREGKHIPDQVGISEFQ
jgi:hypothetical protein